MKICIIFYTYAKDNDNQGESALEPYIAANKTKIITNDDNCISYVYDTNGQLVRANSKNLNRTYLYCYDARESITSKQIYLYSEGTHMVINIEVVDTYS